MGKRLALFLMIGVLALGALAACGGSAPTTPASSSAAFAGSTSSATAGSGTTAGGVPVTAVEIDATEMSFTPNEITTPANSTLTITFKNVGIVLHDFTMDKDGSGKKIHVEADLGQTKTIKVQTGPPGTLEFYCSQPRHREAGMDGHIIVK